MDFPDLSDITVTLKLGATIAVTFSVAGLGIVYRKELKKFLEDADVTIRLRLFGIIDVEVKNLEQLQSTMSRAGVKMMPLAGAKPAPRGRHKDTEARNVVVQSWELLQHRLRDAAVVQQLPGAQTHPARDLIQLLARANAVSPEVATAVNALYDEGAKVVQSQGWKLGNDYAAVYEQLVGNLASWLREAVVAPPKPPPEPPRQTTVGGYFPPPHPGRPAALLVGIDGAVNGQNFPIERDWFHIGSSPENDLVIAGDEYVSGKHAYVRYDKGTLLLADNASRNGTFVNDRRLTQMTHILRPGDRIRLGTATLQVTQAPVR